MSNRGIHVLVVDDEPSASLALRSLLTAEGFEARVANGGRAALACVAERVPDVIVTDLTMPEMSGMQLLEELRARQIETPVIVATAMNDVGRALAAVRAGAVDYLAKPVDAHAMIVAIERAMRTRALVRDAAELRRTNEALAVDGERNLRAREELLSIVAHDLRGPLSTILMACALQSEEGDAAVKPRALQIVLRAATRMSKLVEELLDVARIEGGGLTLDLDSFRASAILQEVLGLVEPIAKESGIRIELAIAEDFSLRCAFGRIVQVLVNLTSNAINISAKGSVVRVVVVRQGVLARFSVEDEGPGITPENLGHVFEHGWRLDGGRRKGAGLGLSIAKGIVEAHAGTIGVESVLGTGSVFHFELPIEGGATGSWHLDH